MVTFDSAPLSRSTVGFDRLFDRLDEVLSGEAAGYPAYDIVRSGENEFRISLAVPGYSPSRLSIETRDRVLTVEGEATAGGDEVKYLYRGIATPAFRRSFRLAEHTRVSGARLADGVLHIELAREVPEALRPRRIEIRQEGAGGETARPVIEQPADAA